MTPPESLLDTDILSAIMRKNEVVLQRAQAYIDARRQFTISIITRYELLRGLNAKKAGSQIRAFDFFCASSNVLGLTDEVVERAAEIYGDLHRRGELISDADILIAATALVHDYTLVTNNEDHFRRIPGLKVDNWLK